MAAGSRKTVRLKTPVRAEDLEQLELGDVVYLEGHVYTAREGVYKRVITEGHKLPEGLTELTNVSFHCSPAASVNDEAPSTSARSQRRPASASARSSPPGLRRAAVC